MVSPAYCHSPGDAPTLAARWNFTRTVLETIPGLNHSRPTYRAAFACRLIPTAMRCRDLLRSLPGTGPISYGRGVRPVDEPDPTAAARRDAAVAAAQLQRDADAAAVQKACCMGCGSGSVRTQVMYGKARYYDMHAT